MDKLKLYLGYDARKMSYNRENKCGLMAKPINVILLTSYRKQCMNENSL